MPEAHRRRRLHRFGELEKLRSRMTGRRVCERVLVHAICATSSPSTTANSRLTFGIDDVRHPPGRLAGAFAGCCTQSSVCDALGFGVYIFGKTRQSLGIVFEWGECF